MLKIFLATMTASAFLAASYLPAAAHDDGSVDARQKRQAHKIERGRISGQITWREGLKLRRQQRKIAHLERKFRSDGHLSEREMGILHDMLDRARVSIRAEKHDSYRRWSALPRVGR